MSLSIYRVDYSPYFAAEFPVEEKKAINALGHSFLENSVHEANVLLTNTSTSIENLNSYALNSLKLIIHPNSGFDNFTPEFIQKLNCPFVLGNSLRQRPVAENIVTHLMGHNQQVNQLTWIRDKKLIKRKLLQNQNALVYGFGHIGKDVVNFLRPMLNKVTVVDPYENLSCEFLDLGEFDYIILCCSLNSKNIHMIDKKYLNQLKKNVVLINSARGPLIHWESLVDFLESHPQAKAYLDVFETEPLELENFNHLTNLHKTSHIAGVHEGLDQAIIDFECQVLQDFTNLGNKPFQTKYEKLLLKNKIVKGEFI